MDNLDILQILKMGLPGLVFLLSVLSFRLLSKEQEKSNPNERVLHSICRFMYINVFLAVLTLASPIIESNFLTPHKDFKIEVSEGPSSLKRNQAAVCLDAGYSNQFLLLRGNNPTKLIQVQAKPILPCQEQTLIGLNMEDLKNLKDQIQNPDSQTVLATVSIAPKGYKFQLEI